MTSDLGLDRACSAQPPFRSALWSLTAVVLAAAFSFSQQPLPGLAWWLLAAPLVEELLARAGLQNALVRHGWPAAPLWVALACAGGHLLHQSPLQAALGGVAALSIGWIYARTRRLGDCVALHALANAAWVFGGAP